MKKLLLTLLLFAIFPVYGRSPMRAVVFHKNIEEGNKRYGTALDKHWLHAVILKKSKEPHTITVLVDREIYVDAKIGDTLLVKYRKLLDKATFQSIRPAKVAKIEEGAFISSDIMRNAQATIK